MTNLLLFPDLHEPAPPRIPDAEARAEALDIRRSFLVEAPAGSGKTGLLIQRFLKLLAVVDDPAEVLAITFTRKATSEMLERVLAQLASAASGTEPTNEFDRATSQLAQQVLARDAKLGWNLLDNPARFNIRTIDSLSQQIAGALPVLSGSGGAQSPTEDSASLYREAARRTLMQLGGSDIALNRALETLLLHRDGDLANCESLIVNMLGTRDQWGELVPLSRTALDDRYLDETILPALDRALDRAICRSLSRLAGAFPAGVLRSLSELAAEMALNDGYRGNASPIALCRDWSMEPEEKTSHLDHWRALVDLLLTEQGTFRAEKGIKINTVGFLIQRHQKAELARIIDLIRGNEPLRETLRSVRTLPPAEYPREQWPVAKALFRVLARALAELKVAFAERGQCDFAEIALLARDALRTGSALDDLSAGTGMRLQHLLVDEMQDTSTAQYEFLELLTRRWDGHSQTVFLVGDPKQSIYLFRQARVERFVRTLLSARLGDLPLSVLRLTANFRSVPQLVAAFNDDFSRIFPAEADPEQPELVPYSAASPIRNSDGERIWHADPIPYASDASAPRTQAIRHAQEVRELIRSQRCKQPGAKIGVLVRSRAHLAHIITALEQSPPIPYRAVDIKPLGERPEILDLLALTRALLHPADRTAWLALLRSPAVGLSLADLHRLAGDADKRDSERTIFELISTRGDELSEDGIAQLEPFWAIMDAALKQRGRQPLSQWVERTWRTFCIPAYSAPDALLNAERFFQLLDKLAAQDEPGATLSLGRLQEQVDKLYAAPSTDPDAVDLMTLHKAKGLEWDMVIVPELHRKANQARGALLQWLESSPGDASDEEIAAGILAPISSKGRATHQLNAWMRSIETAREAAERRRLFYVACTRARQELHLFAAPKRKKDGGFSIGSDTLLEAAWPAAQECFERANVVAFPQPAPTFAIAATTAPRIIERIPLALSGSSQIVASTQATLPHVRFDRPDGGFAARAFGNAMHTFLEHLAARLAEGATIPVLLAEVPTWSPRIAAVLRANGLAPADIDRYTADLLRGLTRMLNHEEGQWILAPRTDAASESSLTSWREDLSTIRLDRSFHAGPTPLTNGSDYLWIVDYKTTSHGAGKLDAFLESERKKHAPQLEAYARELTLDKPIRLALYYPMLPQIIWWEAP